MSTNKKDNKKEEIIFTAMKHFSKFGYEKTKLLDIANEAKTSTTTVYSFFKTKHDLYEAAVEYDLNIINFELERIVSESSTLDEYIINIIERVRLKSDKKQLLLNFYMLVSTNSVQIKNLEIIEEFERKKFSYYLKFIENPKIKDRYTLLFIDNIINIYIYSYFNLFYQKKLLLYLSLYQQDKETTEFEEDLLKYLNRLH
ncbi:TetR family transcriptional regulator [Enterococcus faecium]|uniref:TetR/AcrR family transcriptional regulator n=1 Tax=Enterococcus faecium TaxID=1352 RepID=UPI000A184691|nr:TetR/AcrR family transcriptional regulator [Enterococcus faecium]MCZ1262396.1 TetR/AcrR family transcriptional regulator [Enterococcus faecium]SMJ25100.1 TetR family transcriptional regulator [Enterococcus faecium]SMJ40569.1 TetR family transcriptional regulator [Enterococcus faecium]SMJ62232.1 TetR family transcriptional regulator [Enterococcus faecium]SMJ98547.1 TetR family transcriptional regulator [Enterococcus faecium]